MSERGSFVTEYIYCKQCVKGLISYFGKERNHKYFCVHRLPGWSETDHSLPIFAGKVGGSYDVVTEFEVDRAEEISEVICHPVRFAILGDDPNTAATLVISPDGVESRVLGEGWE